MPADTREAPKMQRKETLFIDAIRSALLSEMTREQRVIVFGMDVGRLGGVFRVTQGLQERFGPDRVVDMPMSEGAIVGAAIGLAAGGMIPVAEIQFLGFANQAMHQLGAQLGRFRARSLGRYPMPVTIRAPYGGGLRTPEFHPDAIESAFVQSPGLKVVCPAFPADAKGMLIAAVRDPDPVLYLEPQRLYRSVRGDVPDGDHVTPLGSARVVREGTDLTFVAWSAAVHLCLRASDHLAANGISAAVLDLRSLVPLDVDGLIGAVGSTGRAVVVHEAPLTGGFGAEIAATIQESAYGAMKGPVLRVAAHDVPYPPGILKTTTFHLSRVCWKPPRG